MCGKSLALILRFLLYNEVYVIMNTLMAFTVVTTAHGPSPQPTACGSPKNIKLT